MISRRKSREFLLQSLYSRHELKWAFDRASFVEAYFSGDNALELDTAYVDQMESTILEHETNLIGLVSLLAPRFDLATIPVMHIMIIMIALAEILYAKNLETPDAVAVNEAIELAKRFSDDQGRMFINGALSTFLKKRETLIMSAKTWDFRIFS